MIDDKSGIGQLEPFSIATQCEVMIMNPSFSSEEEFIIEIYFIDHKNSETV